MNKAIFLAVLMSANFVFAQSSVTAALKKSRVQMEKETESKILEKIEEQRYQEEQNRLRNLDNVSFNVVAPVQSETSVYNTAPAHSAASIHNAASTQIVAPAAPQVQIPTQEVAPTAVVVVPAQGQ